MIDEHGFHRRNIYGEGGTYNAVLVTVHHRDHAKHQPSLSHRNHVPEIELEREKLLAQYWTGKQWTRAPEPQQPWTKLEPGISIGEPDLMASLLEVVRVFGRDAVSFRLERRQH